MKAQRRVAVAACLLVYITFLSASPIVRAQATTSIRGMVSDPSGTPIPGARVTLDNSGTAALRVTSTDEIGGYEFPQLPPGTYRIRAETPGFKSVVRENLQLLVN